MSLTTKGDAAQTAALAALLAFTPDFSGSQADIAGELERAYLAAYRAKTGVSVAPPEVTQQAASVAADRAATLVQDLAQTTQDAIAGLVTQAENGDWDEPTLRDAVAGHSTFAPAWALLIAATEVTIAWGAGSRQAADDGGETERQWVTAGDADVCEDCQANEDAGWIGMDEGFPSGDDDVPAHPQCRCDTEYRGGAEQAAAAPVLVKQVRCPDCHRRLGRNLNVGGTVWCNRCSAEKTVT